MIGARDAKKKKSRTECSIKRRSLIASREKMARLPKKRPKS